MSALEIRARQADIGRRWLLSAPALTIIFFAATGPLLIVLVYSFLTPGPYGDVEWVFSTEGWVSVFLERDIFDGTLSFADAHITIIWRSIQLAGITTILTLIFGFPTAWFIATRPAGTREIWLFLITIPFWTNVLIRTFGILQIIRNEGLLNTLLLKAHLIAQPVQILYTDAAILIGMVYVYFPLMVLPIYASLEKLDFRLVEAGSDLYATPFQVLRRVILPLVRPGIVAGSILVFIPAIGAYVAPSILGGGKKMMMANLIQLQFGQGRNWPLGAAISVTVMVIVMVALVFYARNASRESRRG